jgi:hypothetical protein
MHRPGPMGRMLNYKGARGLGAALDRETAVLRGRVRKIDRRGIPAPCPRVHDARAGSYVRHCYSHLSFPGRAGAGGGQESEQSAPLNEKDGLPLPSQRLLLRF